MAHGHRSDILVPAKERSEIHTQTHTRTEQSPVLQKGSKLPLDNGRFGGNGIVFSTIEKMRINKDPIFLAAVSWTEIYLYVDHSSGPTHPENIGHGA